ARTTRAQRPFETVQGSRDDLSQVALSFGYPQCPGLQSGETLYLVERRHQPRGVDRDGSGERAVLVGRAAEQLLLDELGETLDGVDRGPQLVKQLPHAVDRSVGPIRLRSSGGAAHPSAITVEVPGELGEMRGCVDPPGSCHLTWTDQLDPGPAY